MGFAVGLVGLPNAGKSTLFNALTAAGAEVGAYPFTTVDRNVAKLDVPDKRLQTIANITGAAKITPTALQIVDIAGLVRGAHKGEGLGNQFLAHIREVDLVAHVVRCFASDRVAHVYGQVDPARDAEVVDLELALADLETVERRLDKSRRKAKSGLASDQAEVDFLVGLRERLAGGEPARKLRLSGAQAGILAELFLLTAKPELLVGNVSDTDFAAATAVVAQRAGATAAAGGSPTGGSTALKPCTGPPGWADLVTRAAAAGCPAVAVSAAVEAEWVTMPDDEKDIWRGELGAVVRGGAAFIQAAYAHLDVITFYTVNENEARAHTVSRGTAAYRAAGKIHTDMERGFIRAEVVPAADLERAGSMAAVRHSGLARVEGRDYVVRDGDIMLFRFSPPA